MLLPQCPEFNQCYYHNVLNLTNGHKMMVMLLGHRIGNIRAASLQNLTNNKIVRLQRTLSQECNQVVLDIDKLCRSIVIADLVKVDAIFAIVYVLFV